MSERQPAELFPARDFIAEELAARGWSWEDFATILGYPLAHVEAYLDGVLYPATFPLEVSMAFGTSPEMWQELLNNTRKEATPDA